MNIKQLPILQYYSEINSKDKLLDIEEWIGLNYRSPLISNINERRGLIIFKNTENLENSKKFVINNEWKEINLNLLLTPNGCIVDFTTLPN